MRDCSPRPLRSQDAGAAAAALPARDPLYLRGVVLVMLAGVFWSIAGILIRQIETASEWQILLVRSFAAFATLLIILAVRYRGRVQVPFRAAGWNGVIGGACLMFGFIGFVFALISTTVANAVFILSAGPLMTAILAWLILKEHVRRVTWIAITVAILGIAIMVAGGIQAGVLFGNVMALIATLGFAGFAVALRRGRAADMLPAACLAALFAGLLSLFLVPDYSISLHDAAICVTMGVVQIGAGLALFTIGSRYVPAAELVLLSLTEVVLAPIWVWIGVGEVPRWLTLIGGAVVLSAIVGQALSGLRRKPPPIGAV